MIIDDKIFFQHGGGKYMIIDDKISFFSMEVESI